jgi:hypothetical protein
VKNKIKSLKRSEREKNNSRVEELKIKSQAAMEYLMTYGWAILIIALVLGVLYSLGILSPETFKPQICSLSAPFYCSGQYLDTNGFLTLTIAQGSGLTITINKIACVDKSLLLSNGLPSSPSYWSSVGVSIPSGSQRQIGNIICYSSSGQPYSGKIGSVFSGAIIINATTSTGANIFSLGEIGAPVNALSAFRASGWSYRRPITINNTKNSNTLSNYQVLVTLDTASLISAGKMRSDCGDIRFTDSDAQTLLSYWIESGCNSANTKIWVKVPSIPASSTKTIYVYYGNPNATSLSNAENTFTETGTFYHTRYSTSDPNSLAEGINFYNSAQDTQGYCWKYISNYSGIANHGVCPSGSSKNIAYWIEAFFYANVSGTWEFRFGVDYGRGGGLYIDGNAIEEAWSANLWWSYNWNSSGVLKGSKYLTVGWHKLFSLGFEDCCDGGTALQFKEPSGNWTTWSTTNLEIKSREYTSPEPTTSVGAEQSI